MSKKDIIKVAIHSVPRSGSSWVGQIFNSSPTVNYKFQPLFSYAFKGYLDENSTKEKIDEFFLKIAKSNDEFLLQKDKVEKGIYPKFYKTNYYTHIIYKEVRYHNILKNMMKVHPKVKLIGIIRNPLAVINSFLRAPREFRKDLGWNELKEWRDAPSKNQGRKEEFFGYENWKKVALLLHQLKEKYPDRVFILRYSHLLANSISITKKLFNFVDLEFSEQTENFLLESRKKNFQDPYSVFKNKVKDVNWKKELSPQIIKEILNDLKNDHLLSQYLEE